MAALPVGRFLRWALLSWGRMEDNPNARSTAFRATQKADILDEEEKQRKLHDTLQQVLAMEAASHEALDSRIKGVTLEDDFNYRTIMTMINLTRTFGQVDGMSMMLSQETSDKNESASATLDHILAEVGALMERLQQLQAEGIRLCRVINE